VYKKAKNADIINQISPELNYLNPDTEQAFEEQGGSFRVVENNSGDKDLASIMIGNSRR
jgi:hypothetical protein